MSYTSLLSRLTLLQISYILISIESVAPVRLSSFPKFFSYEEVSLCPKIQMLWYEAAMNTSGTPMGVS